MKSLFKITGLALMALKDKCMQFTHRHAVLDDQFPRSSQICRIHHLVINFTTISGLDLF